MDIRGVGYLVIASPQRKQWQEYLTGVVGMMTGGGGDGVDWFRMDDRVYRIAVEDSKIEAYVPGWELASERAFDEAVVAIEASGTRVERCDRADARLRHVGGLARLQDPFGNPHELFWGQMVTEDLFHSPQGMSGFNCGELGVGHVLYVVPSSATALSFYRDTLGLAVTDYFTWGGPSSWFLRCNPRHHSVGFVDLDLPGGPGVNHFMIEAKTLHDVGRSLDRAMDSGCEIVNSLGQHSNDKCVSYYMRSPGRANVEVGTGQLRIDSTTWQVIAWSGRGDYWGHRGPFMDVIADTKPS